MTLAETYALSCGVKLDKPEIVDTFFPLDLPLDKVILIHAFAGGVVENNGVRSATFPAKIYDYFGEVVELLLPIVEPLGYKFYQIGGAGEQALAGVEYMCGRLTVHQSSYLVKNASLLLGNDSIWAHVRGASMKPVVIAYGSTSKPHFPHWRDDGKSFLIESHRNGRQPSYASSESPKTIDLIPPEELANACLKGLGIDKTISRKSLYIGPDYLHQVIELVPDVVVHPKMNITSPVVARMDYLFNEECLFANLQFRKMTIITDREIDIEKIKAFKPNIIGFRVEVDKVSAAWIGELKKTGIKAEFFSAEKDERKLNKLRLELFNSCFFDTFVPSTKEDFLKYAKEYLNKDLDPSTDVTKILFKTNKAILSNGKIFLSKPHWQQGRHTASSAHNIGEVIDDPAFWEDCGTMYFFTE
jgi:hypothetical protein